MRRFFAALFGLNVGYVICAFVGYFVIALFSSNPYDVSVEAAMTAAFAIGPAGAIVGLVIDFRLGRTRR
ncbi:MAG TPA: hypothetical protein VG271_14795 [Beijerinckiaceae bacterium]|nr:hypothetical protein [Beijerinckiaceae bacterium]